MQEKNVNFHAEYPIQTDIKQSTHQNTKQSSMIQQTTQIKEHAKSQR
jgi:hypothetical protein